MDKSEKIITALIIVMVLVLVYLLVTQTSNFKRNFEISQAEQKVIMAQLRAKSADDCVLTRTESGYKCTEIRTGKVYRIMEREALTK